MKKSLKITFFNPNTEEQIVQAIAGVLAYNLAENDEKIQFDYKSLKQLDNQKLQQGIQKSWKYCNGNSNFYQNFHEEARGVIAHAQI